jgi:predicted GNAT family acetyltransferase
MTRVFFVILSLLLASSASAEARFCLNIFTFSRLSDKFSEMEYNVQQELVSVTGDSRVSDGEKVVVGKAELDGTANGITRQVATISYTFKNSLLTITSARIPSEFTGEGIYRRLLARILQENPDTKIIMTSLSGVFYQRFLQDLAAIQSMEISTGGKSDEQLALQTNEVYGELAKLGFSKVRSMSLLNYSQQDFLRFSVELVRP